MWDKPLYLINSDVIPTDTTHLAKMHIPFHIEYTKGTGHYAMIETPDDFNQRLEKILALIR
jgi:pimeloyl-ACP methyl ester carboxylesterase